MAYNRWSIVWWFPLMKSKTGFQELNCFVSRYGTVYTWIWEKTDG